MQDFFLCQPATHLFYLYHYCPLRFFLTCLNLCIIAGVRLAEAYVFISSTVSPSSRHLIRNSFCASLNVSPARYVSINLSGSFDLFSSLLKKCQRFFFSVTSLTEFSFLDGTSFCSSLHRQMIFFLLTLKEVSSFLFAIFFYSALSHSLDFVSFHLFLLLIPLLLPKSFDRIPFVPCKGIFCII